MNQKDRKTLALNLTAELQHTSEQYHVGTIDYQELGRRNRQTWDRIEQAGIRAIVLRKLRNIH